MNRQDIISLLERYNLDKDIIIIISESAMVMHNIGITKSVDLSVSKDYEEELLKKYDCKKEEKNSFETFVIDGIINFSSYCYDKFKYDEDGFKIQTLEDIVKFKNVGDNDMELIRNYIGVKNINSLSLAYLGDAVYELYIREFLIKYNLKVNDLQSKAIDFVSARAQSKYLDRMISENFLKDCEIEIVKRARNHKSHSSKNADIITYKKSTGLEALIGYLKLTNNIERIEEIMKYIVGE